jgi:inorganic pyrophosphatase
MSTRIVAVLVPFILLAAGVAGHAGNLLTSAPTRNPDGSVNALIEIPAGTNAKWEVNEEGVLEWEMKDGKPRVVRYLAYPGSYGRCRARSSPRRTEAMGTRSMSSCSVRRSNVAR